MKISIKAVLFALSMSVLFLSACGGGLTPEEQEAMMLDERWLLETVGGIENVNTDTLQPNHLMLPSSIPGTAMAFSGCNTLAAKYEMEGTSISFSNVISTRKTCEEMVLENSFIEALERANRFRIRDNKMELFEGRGKLATFVRDEGEFSLPQLFDHADGSN